MRILIFLSILAVACCQPRRGHDHGRHADHESGEDHDHDHDHKRHADHGSDEDHDHDHDHDHKRHADHGSEEDHDHDHERPAGRRPAPMVQHHYYNEEVTVYVNDDKQDRHSRGHSGKHKRGHYGSRHHGDHHDHDDHHDDDSWTFHVSHVYAPWLYTGEDGILQGFEIDLIHALCQKAGKQCYYILDVHNHCWDPSGGFGHGHPGQGLLAGWYDGCMGFLPTPERLNSFNFTRAFSENFECALHYRAGELQKDAYNLTDVRIGFVAGWAVNKECLYRQSSTFSGNQEGEFVPVMFDNHDALIAGLQNREVDLVLTADKVTPGMREELGLDVLDNWFQCTLSGASVMARYGSPLINWWNAAFQEMIDDGSFEDLCREAEQTHGSRGEIYCLRE